MILFFAYYNNIRNKLLGGFSMTDRDSKIIKWIEENKSITIDQCSKLFYTVNTWGYDQARKRLRDLKSMGFIKRYRQDPKSEAVYFMDKKLNVHALKLMDVIVYLQDFSIYNIIKEHKLEIDSSTNYTIDCTASLNYKGKAFPVIVEVDYTHFTSIEKIKNMIRFLEKKHDIGYFFIVIKISQDNIRRENVGRFSSIVWVPWRFNKDAELSRSLCSLLKVIKVE